MKKITYTEFVGNDKDERIISFAPLLHLDNQKKIWMAQPEHFEEIDIWLKHVFLKHNPNPIEELKKELEREIKELDNKKRKRLKKINKDFENPLGEELSS